MAYIELRLDLFPALIRINPDTDQERVLRETRLFVGLDEIWIWQWASNGTVELVLNERYETLTGRRTTGWTAELGDGSTIWFQRAPGCGCGNPLRGWIAPFATVQGQLL